MPRHLLLHATALALVLGWSARAVASPSYPNAVQKASGSPCPPPCTVCHESESGGYGTATKPFAESMMAVGDLEAEDEQLVAPAIAALKAAQIDSDADGVDDVSELALGDDPNLFGEGDLCGPQYGCGARVEPEGPIDGAAVALAAGVVALMLARRRRP